MLAPQGCGFAPTKPADAEHGYQRMADAAAWMVAAEESLGLEQGSFMKAYVDNRAEGNALTLEASKVAAELVSFMDPRTEWSGTATVLMDTLDQRASDETKRVEGLLPFQPDFPGRSGLNFVVDLWEQPTDDEHWRVPIKDVTAAIVEACRKYDVLEVACDSYRWQATMAELEAEGLPVTEFSSPARWRGRSRPGRASTTPSWTGVSPTTATPPSRATSITSCSK